MKIAFIVQRYGQEVVGGSETLARQYAALLNEVATVEVLTTCALDHVTWRNRFAPGATREDGVIVRRFLVDFERSAYWQRLNGMLQGEISLYEFCQSAARKQAHAAKLASWPRALQEEFIRCQGPYSSDLFDYLLRRRGDYDIFLFFTYCFPTTFFGLRQVDPDRAILCPTFHDEPMAYLPAYGEMLQRPCFTIFLSEAERRLARTLGGMAGPSAVVGLAVVPPSGEVQGARPENYFLYAGRIEQAKGCQELVHHFLAYKVRHPSDAKLVLIGRKVCAIPDHPDVQYLGFVSETEKYALMKKARAFINPSAFESFSIVLMESLGLGTPALVNGHCAVTAEHVRQSGAGLTYGNQEEFIQGLWRLWTDAGLRQKMGERGRCYVACRFATAKVAGKLQSIVKNVARQRGDQCRLQPVGL